MRLSLLILAVLCASLWSGASEPPYASKQPLTEPTIFGSGIVSTADFDSHPAFTPDGKTLYFVVRGGAAPPPARRPPHTGGTWTPTAGPGGAPRPRP